MEIEEIVKKQRAFFLTGATLPFDFRRDALARLRTSLIANEKEILTALRQDLNKSTYEAFLTEFSIVMDELKIMQSHLKEWMRPRRKKTPLSLFPARCVEIPEPFGNALILSPWNYPFQLTFSPLIGALAAGNTVVLKPSANTPHVSALIGRIVKDTFQEEYVAVIQGGRAENTALLEQKFDYIFFTGSPAVGKVVMAAAAKHLTPITLELGGKSPCIIDKSADITLAARRIAFGKLLNAGQTCVAPDYCYVHQSRQDAFLAALQNELMRAFPDEDYSTFPSIVNDAHFARIQGLIDPAKLIYGGNSNAKSRFMQPVILNNVEWSDAVMQEEIFGPILPVLPFNSFEEVIYTVQAHPKPLALYLFTDDPVVEQQVIERLSFGGGCINDTVMHVANPYLGFGGVGESGMGRYHGQLSFDAFSHKKSIVKKGRFLDIWLRYRPYTDDKLKWLRRIL